MKSLLTIAGQIALLLSSAIYTRNYIGDVMNEAPSLFYATSGCVSSVIFAISIVWILRTSTLIEDEPTVTDRLAKVERMCQWDHLSIHEIARDCKCVDHNKYLDENGESIIPPVHSFKDENYSDDEEWKYQE